MGAAPAMLAGGKRGGTKGTRGCCPQRQACKRTIGRESARGVAALKKRSIGLSLTALNKNLKSCRNALPAPMTYLITLYTPSGCP